MTGLKPAIGVIFLNDNFTIIAIRIPSTVQNTQPLESYDSKAKDGVCR